MQNNTAVVAVLWLGLVIASISPRRSRLNPGSAHVRLVVDELALGQVALPALPISTVSNILLIHPSPVPAPALYNLSK
jgi:hypothetical protein